MIKKIANLMLGVVGLKLLKANNNSEILSYISAKETIKNAQKKGLSVCEYVEKIWDQVGKTQKVIDNMEKFGAFRMNNPTVCEIGAGTGRYMEKVIAKCATKRYESYETASDWTEWLAKEYPIISRETDGASLKYTENNFKLLGNFFNVHGQGKSKYFVFKRTNLE